MACKKALYRTGDAICDEVLGLLEKYANETLAKRDKFRVGLSGGSLADILCEGMADLRSDFSKWQIFFCDERIVPVADKESTWGIFKRQLLTTCDIVPESAFFPVNCALDVEAAATDYEQTIRRTFGLSSPEEVPSFDLLILGIGPDGHTVSLFPEHPLLQEKARLIAPIADSPKPPPKRVTMTLPLINNAKVCLFGAQGGGKAEILKRIVVDRDRSLPATLVDPVKGQLIFVACDAAAALIEGDPLRGC
ncbi:probable 6-phosphogluconolactonase [Anopheles bellator]|uniref:probable 6-phosphogluconolactonase n=1 Tax=Anopheles bellator TaxID=139047 RepID=UPI0026495086|nr:probable 6-phosphogluconolactonase [Anopheles bellator]